MLFIYSNSEFVLDKKCYCVLKYKSQSVSNMQMQDMQIAMMYMKLCNLHIHGSFAPEMSMITHCKSFSWCSSEVPGTAENARSCVRAYFADLHETLCRQEEMALSVVDAHVRERLIWLRQQQEDMTILLSQVSTACLHCEKTLQQVRP